MGIVVGVAALLTGGFVDHGLDYAYDVLALRRTLSRLPPERLDYRRGAVEFYQKNIERNGALWELLGEHGPRNYTEDGKVKRVWGLWPQSYQTHLLLARAELDLAKGGGQV
jgi:hypothetical protein